MEENYFSPKQCETEKMSADLLNCVLDTCLYMTLEVPCSYIRLSQEQSNSRELQVTNLTFSSYLAIRIELKIESNNDCCFLIKFLEIYLNFLFQIQNK